MWFCRPWRTVDVRSWRLNNFREILEFGRLGKTLHWFHVQLNIQHSGTGVWVKTGGLHFSIFFEDSRIAEGSRCKVDSFWQDPALPWDTGVVLWVDAGNYLPPGSSKIKPNLVRQWRFVWILRVPFQSAQPRIPRSFPMNLAFRTYLSTSQAFRPQTCLARSIGGAATGPSKPCKWINHEWNHPTKGKTM